MCVSGEWIPSSSTDGVMLRPSSLFLSRKSRDCCYRTVVGEQPPEHTQEGRIFDNSTIWSYFSKEMSPNNKCVWFQLLVFLCLQTAPHHLIISKNQFQNVLQTQTTDPSPAQYNSRERGEHCRSPHHACRAMEAGRMVLHELPSASHGVSAV